MRNPENETAPGLASESGGNFQSSRETNLSEALFGRNLISPQAKWAATHPKEMWAHACLRSAIKKGLIDREPCEVCGVLDVDGHHDDYDMPMVVRWLCRLHHKAEHRRMRCEAVNG